MPNLKGKKSNSGATLLGVGIALTTVVAPLFAERSVLAFGQYGYSSYPGYSSHPGYSSYSRGTGYLQYVSYGQYYASYGKANRIHSRSIYHGSLPAMKNYVNYRSFPQFYLTSDAHEMVAELEQFHHNFNPKATSQHSELETLIQKHLNNSYSSNDRSNKAFIAAELLGHASLKNFKGVDGLIYKLYKEVKPLHAYDPDTYIIARKKMAEYVRTHNPEGLNEKEHLAAVLKDLLVLKKLGDKEAAEMVQQIASKVVYPLHDGRELNYSVGLEPEEMMQTLKHLHQLKDKLMVEEKVSRFGNLEASGRLASPTAEALVDILMKIQKLQSEADERFAGEDKKAHRKAISGNFMKSRSDEFRSNHGDDEGSNGSNIAK